MSRENYSTYYNIQIKKAPEGAILKNGARNGLLLEPLKAFLHVVKNEEYRYIEDNLFDIAA